MSQESICKIYDLICKNDEKLKITKLTNTRNFYQELMTQTLKNIANQLPELLNQLLKRLEGLEIYAGKILDE
jgi:hypothetical protein